jgi:hypothetical protein
MSKSDPLFPLSNLSNPDIFRLFFVAYEEAAESGFDSGKLRHHSMALKDMQR